MNSPVIIGIAGGSGSGKTTFASRLREALGAQLCSMIAQDHYYRDQSHRFDHDGGSVNFDHPDALDFLLMAKHLEELKKGGAIESPRYCFESHTRKPETVTVSANKFILVDGILIFTQPKVIRWLDHKIFIDCEEALRFARRLKRDVEERGRTPEGVEAQFVRQVKPMHDLFVEPSKSVACDLVNPENFDEKTREWVRVIQGNRAF